MHARFLLALLSSFLLVGTTSAGPITVFTEIWSAGGNIYGNIPVSGLGIWGTLIWGNGPGSTSMVTVPAGQTTASHGVVGYLPVIEFSNFAQYQAQISTVVTVPPTPVQLDAVVWDGPYSKQLLINATISAQVSPTAGLNTVDWQFSALPVQVAFGDGTVVSLNYQAVTLPPSAPLLQFQDGTIFDFPQMAYYTTLVDADVTVSIATPEPSSAVLLAGLTLGSLVARRSRRALVAKNGVQWRGLGVE